MLHVLVGPASAYVVRSPTKRNTAIAPLARPPQLLFERKDLVHRAFVIAVDRQLRPELPEISGVRSSFKDPRYATSIGLIRYAQILDTESATPPGMLGKIGGMFWPFKR